MREKMKSEIMQDALSFLDDEMIKEVEDLREKQELEKNQNKRQPRFWRRWTGLAASICVLIIAGGVWYGIENDGFKEHMNSGMQESLPTDENTNVENDSLEDVIDKESMTDKDESMNGGPDSSPVTLPAYQVNLGKQGYSESDMALFFIYEGRCYVQTCDYMTKDVIGEYVCTTTGLIDEWTKEDGYVELAGSFEADIYMVAGVDPKFMLCTVYDDGVVETFTHNNNITLSCGDDILEWLGFEVGQEKYEVFCSKGNSCDIAVSEESQKILDKFLDNFAISKAILRKDISVTTNAEDIYHLTIVTEEGVPLHFVLLNDGYVSYYGLQEVCVKIDQRVYKVLLDVLEEK